jgi:GNAT superfamily N-acetyltransferase
MLKGAEFVALDTRRHDVRSFDCGSEPQTTYLRRYAARNAKLNLNRTFILPWHHPRDARDRKARIAAYYTLAGLSVTSTPEREKLPRYPVPVILLAQLAVDARFQNQGLGSRVLVHALRHAERITTSEESLPARGAVLDVASDQAMKFYAQFAFFEPFPANPARLFVSISSIREHLL